MNTKKYKKLFDDNYAQGKIPKELYDRLMSEIAADGKMTKRIYTLYLDELERLRAFDVASTPHTYKNSIKTDGTYKYSRPKNPFWHLAHAFWSTVFKFFGWFGSITAYGVWRVRDRKKLKSLKRKPFITVSNHVGYLDCVLTRRALGCKKQYIVAAGFNNKRTPLGHMLRSATIIPLPMTFGGTRRFNARLEDIKKQRGAIHFYAEQVMWARYRKPRPYKDGAFMYATMLDLPVVPMLYCFKRSRGIRKLFGLAKAAIRISDPVYPDKTLPPHERRADLAARVAKATRELYEDFYGIPLEYLPERVKHEESDEAENTNNDKAAVEKTDEKITEEKVS